MSEEGRPLVPCVVSTDASIAGPALAVVGYTAVPGGRPVEGAPALPVVVVTAAQVAAGYPVQGNTPVPMVLASAAGTRAILGQRAQPVYVVAGSLDPTPPPVGATRITEAGAPRITQDGRRRITE